MRAVDSFSSAAPTLTHAEEEMVFRHRETGLRGDPAKVKLQKWLKECMNNLWKFVAKEGFFSKTVGSPVRKSGPPRTPHVTKRKIDLSRSRSLFDPDDYPNIYLENPSTTGLSFPLPTKLRRDDAGYVSSVPSSSSKS